jgi:hypothetical protein
MNYKNKEHEKFMKDLKTNDLVDAVKWEPIY